MASSILEKLQATLLAPDRVEKEINGKVWHFYQCSVGVTARMAPLIAKLAGCVSVILGQNNNDQGHKLNEWTDSETGDQMNSTEVNPINPDLAALRTRQQREAIEEAMSSLGNDNYRSQLVQMILNSLRDDYPRRGPIEDEGDIVGSFEQMDWSIFAKFLKGMFEANAKTFGDLGKQLAQAVQGRAAQLLPQAVEQTPATETDG